MSVRGLRDSSLDPPAATIFDQHRAVIRTELSQVSVYCRLHCGQYFICGALSCVSDEFETAEEVGDLDRGVFVGVGAVNGVLADRTAKVFSERARVGFGGIGSAHQIPPRFDGALFFERHDDARAARHEFNQSSEERPFPMNGVETFRLLARHVDQF